MLQTHHTMEQHIHELGKQGDVTTLTELYRQHKVGRLERVSESVNERVVG